MATNYHQLSLKDTFSDCKDKSIGDAASLKPVLSDFFSLHPDFHPDTFLGIPPSIPSRLIGCCCMTFIFPKL